MTRRRTCDRSTGGSEGPRQDCVGQTQLFRKGALDQGEGAQGARPQAAQGQSPAPTSAREALSHASPARKLSARLLLPCEGQADRAQGEAGLGWCRRAREVRAAWPVP